MSKLNDEDAEMSNAHTVMDIAAKHDTTNKEAMALQWASTDDKREAAME
jgi:hypothetical protein